MIDVMSLRTFTAEFSSILVCENKHVFGLEGRVDGMIAQTRPKSVYFIFHHLISFVNYFYNI